VDHGRSTRVIPEEDRGPAWLRDYGYTDFGNIEADIAAMQEFAAKLAADVQNNYAPHLRGVTDAMMTQLPIADPSFHELASFLEAHRAAQDVTHQNVYYYASGTDNLATVAHGVSELYRGSDAFARARVDDVEAEFRKLSIPSAGGDA
jgi:hypothetical protein